MRRWIDFLRTDDIPAMARPNYLAELRHMGLWGAFASMVDGSFSSIVVAKTFQMPELVPVVWATPMVAHLLSFVWGALIRGRRKIRTFNVLALCAIVSAGSIALTPSDWHPWGGWLFTLQLAASRIFLSGLVNVRTSIWKSNYPRTHRARIAGRIQLLNALLLVLVVAVVSTLFDRHPEYYRIAYPLLALVGVLALLPLRRVRIRGERAELRTYRTARGGRGGWRQLASNFHDAAAVLRNDRRFAQYCRAQYLLGSANFMIDPVLSLFLTQTLRLSYFSANFLLDQIATIVSIVTIPAWAHYFDRVGVLRFRVVNSRYWLGSIVLAGLALIIYGAGGAGGAGRAEANGPAGVPVLAGVAIAILVLARVLTGVGRGGGTIGWNLGHLHFARAQDAELYMGIHVALTGIRGIIMPFVGTYLYQWLGPLALLVSMAFAVAALSAFQRLAREEQAASPTVH